MAKKHEHVVSASAPKAYEALTRALEELGHDVKRADERAMSVHFDAKRGFMTVRVAMSATVVDAGNGETKISITGKPAGREWTAWGEEGGVSRDVFRKIDQILPALEDEKPAPASTAPAETAGDETAGDAFTAALERLAALRSSGAINDDEFKHAMAKLLGGPGPATTTQPVSAGEGRATGGNVAEAAAAGALGGVLLSNVDTATAAADDDTSDDESGSEEDVERSGDRKPADVDEHGIPFDLFG